MCEHNYMIVKTTHDAYHKMCFKCGDKRVEKIVTPKKTLTQKIKEVLK